MSWQISPTLIVLFTSKGYGFFLGVRRSPLLWLRNSSMGGPGFWPNLPVSRRSPQGTELRVWVGRSVSLQGGGHRTCLLWRCHQWGVTDFFCCVFGATPDSSVSFWVVGCVLCYGSGIPDR